jgi:transketolase
MRNQFIKSLVTLSRKEPDTFLIVGDLGFGVIEPFAEEFPTRFLNAGVAEQNMLSMAAGIASTGKQVFVYSIANFPSFRALEQIRNDVAYHQLPVSIISVGAGLSYGPLGYSHHAVEDVSVMRAIPEIDIYCPADDFEVEACFRSISSRRKPAYLRLGKGGEKLLHDSVPVDIEGGVRLGQHTGDVLVLSTGSITENVRSAIQTIREEASFSLEHVSVPAITSLNFEKLRVESRVAIVTVEEHSTAGGFGSLVLEELSKRSIFCPTLLIGISNPKLSCVGSHGYLVRQHGLDDAGIAEKIFNFLSNQTSTRRV